MNRIAIFPGSFDPFTLGHESVVLRALPLFDRVIVAIGYNAAKSGYFPLQQRLQWIREVFAQHPNVLVDSYQGLTIDYCRAQGAQYLLRGLRSAPDFEFERNIAQLNSTMLPGLETIFMLTRQEHSVISSSIVREIHRHGGNAQLFVPPAVQLGVV